MFVISVSKTYKHRGRNIKHRPDTKKVWQIMYYDYNEDGELQLYSKYVNSLQAMYYKFHMYYKRKFYCLECNSEFIFLVSKNTKYVECPICLTE